MKEKDEAVAHTESLIEKAVMYKLDMEEELSKGENSALKVDHETSEQTDITHLTLSSINQWANKKYNISILGDQRQNTFPGSTQAQPTTQEKVEGRDSKGRLSKTRADNLFTTFSFLVEAYAKSSNKIVNGEPNNDAVAKHLEKLATNTKTKETLSGQSDEAIKDRIEEAKSIKKSKLPQNT